MFVSLRRTQTWHLHTKLYNFGWHTSANNVQMKNSWDLILGEVVYISIIYRNPDSWLYSLSGYDFSFDHMTGENREYKTVTTAKTFSHLDRQEETSIRKLLLLPQWLQPEQHKPGKNMELQNVSSSVAQLDYVNTILAQCTNMWQGENDMFTQEERCQLSTSTLYQGSKLTFLSWSQLESGCFQGYAQFR